MSYHGAPGPGDGYGTGGYGYSNGYAAHPVPKPPGRYVSNDAVPTADGYLQNMNMQHMNMMQGQSQHQTAYYPQAFVNPQNLVAPNVYYQQAPHAPQTHYTQYPPPWPPQHQHQHQHQHQPPPLLPPPQQQQQYYQPPAHQEYKSPILPPAKSSEEKPTKSHQPILPPPRKSPNPNKEPGPAVGQVQQKAIPVNELHSAATEYPVKRAEPVHAPVQAPPKQKKPGKPKTSSIDIQALLPVLAEEFFNQAHASSHKIAASMGDSDVEQYQSLIATGLGCLEAALKNPKISPRTEARIRLRYASVIFEETQNVREAEVALTKGILLCTQNYFGGLKNSMQILLAKIMFVTSPKASFKVLDGYIEEAEAQGHTAWIYVFRLVRATLSLTSGKPSDIHAATSNLRRVLSIADERGDRFVAVVTALIEVLLNLQFPRTEASQNIQVALATAWKYQQDGSDVLPQLLALTHLLDVTSSLIYETPTTANSKLKAMQKVFDDNHPDTPSWKRSGSSIGIPIGNTETKIKHGAPETAEVLASRDDGCDVLMISWLSKSDLFVLGFLIAGAVVQHKNCLDGKAVRYFQEGLSLLSSDRPLQDDADLLSIQHQKKSTQILTCFFHIQLAFCAGAVADWSATREHIEKVNAALPKMEMNLTTQLLRTVAVYLTGVCYQGLGKFDDALRAYRDPRLALDISKPPATVEESFIHDLAILSVLNISWIHKHRPQHEIDKRLDALEPVCSKHTNKDITTAYNLVRATVETDPPVSNMKTKSYLRASLNGSKTTSNFFLLTICLNVMCSKFFLGVVGEQAEKSARAAAFQAAKTGNKLWASVGEAMLANTLETQGKPTEAQQSYEKAVQLAATAVQRTE